MKTPCTAIRDSSHKIIFLRTFLFLSFLLSTSLAFGQEEPFSIFDLLQQDEVVAITLRTDLGKLLASTTGSADYQAASLSFDTEVYGLQSWHLKVKARGKFRRQICDFPPLKFNFSNTELENKGLASFDKIKLVTHCTDNRAEGNEKLLREYLSYQLYQELSPYSYRVQLVQVQYVDSQGKVSGFKRFGFLIEGTEQLAARFKSEECEDCTYSNQNNFDQQAADIHSMFQYLIGNSDYSIPVLRNVKLLRRTTDYKILPIGYDFDFAGTVDAAYAIPANHLGQLAIRQRIYLGTLAPDARLQETIEFFFSKKEPLLGIVDDFKQLSNNERHVFKEYLLTFYEQMNMIREGGYQNVYEQLRQEHPMAIPDGGEAADYGVSER